MAKKSKKKVFEQKPEIFRYRWEFARRYPKYQKAYKEWKAFKKISWETPKSSFMDIFSKYEIPPLNYGLSYNELLEKAEKYVRRKFGRKDKLDVKERERWEAYYWVLSSGGEAIVSIEDNTHFSFTEEMNSRKFTDVNMLTLNINVKYPIKMILSRVEEEIFMYLNIHGNELQDFSQKRKRFNEYDEYLKIYDLKNAKMKRKEIAEKVYPKACKMARETGDWNLESLVRKIKRQYNEAKRLVNGGYKDIR